MTATFVGSKGSEWLATGVFLPDGRIMLAGVGQDPEIELRGVRAKVIGKDAKAFPVQDTWKPLGSVDTGKVAQPKLGNIDDPLGEMGLGDDIDSVLRTDKQIAADKKRREREAAVIKSLPKAMKWALTDAEDVESADVFRRMTWLDLECTAYWGVFSPDLKSVDTLFRLPRGAGSVTSADIAEDGSVYIAGGATDRIERAAAQVRRLPAVTEGIEPPPQYMVPWTYVAKLTPDLSKILWVRLSPCEQSAPKLRVLDGGDVVVTSPDIRRFSPEGELQLSCRITRSRYPDSVSINPVTGGWCKGGDFLTKTGREPWRTPYFFIMNADGTPELELFRWRGPFAAIDGLGHLVADAQVLKTAYDDRGCLIVTSRSHGGNCVQIRYPYDIERFMPNKLGGIPANSPGCVVKLGPDYNVVGAGVWSDPGFIEAAGHGADGSVTLALRANHVRPVNGLCDLTGGYYITVVSPDVSTRRFASVMPCCGRRVIVAGGSKPEQWATVTGWSQGRPMLLFLSGAVPKETIDGKTHSAPLRTPTQPEFGGGRLDGFAVLLDLSPGPLKPKTQESEIPPAEKRVNAVDPPILPAEGQRFRMGMERYATVHITLRQQPEETLWPRFYYGGADAGGSFTFNADSAPQASFVLRGDHLEQHDHSQDRRVLGSRLRMIHVPDPQRPGKHKRIPEPALRLRIGSMAPWTMVEKRSERKNDIRVSHVPTTRVSGVLQVGEHEIPVKDATCTARFIVPRKVDKSRPGVRPNQAILHVRFSVAAAQMGFTDADIADQQIGVTFSCVGHTRIEYEELNEKTLPSIDAPSPEAMGFDVEP